MDAEFWMVVGLGNPDASHRKNRHNIGFMVVDALCDREDDLQWRSSNRFSAELAKGSLRGEAALLVKPQTYMNLSGRSVGPLARFYRIPPERIIAIHDDVDLDLGRLKIKAGGGDGGHKGIKSLAQDLGSPAFIRLRFGIGRPAFGDVTDFVLKDFRAEEWKTVEKQIKQAMKAVGTITKRGLREAMNRHNRYAPKKPKDKSNTDSTLTEEKVEEKVEEKPVT